MTFSRIGLPNTPGLGRSGGNLLVFRGESGRITALRFKRVQTEVHYDLDAGVYLKFCQKNVFGTIFSHFLANNDQVGPLIWLKSGS